MTAYVFANNAASTVAQALPATATTLKVAPADKTKFPTFSGTGVLKITLENRNTGAYEIVDCTAHDGNGNLTIARAKEGTTAKAFAVNDIVSCRVTAEQLAAVVGGASIWGSISGTVSNQADLVAYIQRRVISVHDPAFGAVGDYNPDTGVGTDDAAAINAALTFAGLTGAGRVVLDPTKKYKYGSKITIPIGVTLDGQASPQGGFAGLGNTAWSSPAIVPTRRFRDMGGSLWACFDAGKGDGTATYAGTDAVGLPNYTTRTATIDLYGSLVNCNVFQYAFDNAKPSAYTDNASWNAAWNSGFMSGLAIRQQADDARLERCFIGGFMQAFLSDFNSRGNVADVVIDCMNGFEVSRTYDVHSFQRIFANIFAAVGYSLSSLVRRGTFMYFHAFADWARVSECFTFGHKVGMYVDTSNFLTVDQFGADNSGFETANYYGIRLVGTNNYPSISNVAAANRQYGVSSDIGATNLLRVNGASLVNCASSLEVVSGDVSAQGVSFQGTGAEVAVNNTGTGVVRCEGAKLNGMSASPYAGNVVLDDPRYVFKNVDYTAKVGEDAVFMDCTVASRAITLPPAAKYQAGARFLVKRYDAVAANTLTINKNAADTQLINRFGLSTASITSLPPLGTAEFVSDGVGTWVMINPAGNNTHWIFACTTAQIAAATTVFVGPNGHSATEALAAFVMPRTGRIAGVQVTDDAAPGVGKNMTITFRKSTGGGAFSDQTMVVTINGANTSGTDFTHPFTVLAGDLVTIRAVNDAAAAAAAVRVAFVVEG